MPIKRNGPALPERETVDCRVPASSDVDVYPTEAARIQRLTRLGIPLVQAAVIAPLAFGEVRCHA